MMWYVYVQVDSWGDTFRAWITDSPTRYGELMIRTTDAEFADLYYQELCKQAELEVESGYAPGVLSC